jgi:hypothetical protein
VAEAFGSSNVSKIVDLTPSADVDGNSIYHPAYAVYENDAPSRVVLFNYVNDESGASDLQYSLSLANGQLPASVSVRYLSAPNVQEHDNITWAGQTLGTSFASDGRLRGEQQTVVVACDNGVCTIPVPAPAIALVFLNDQAVTNSGTDNVDGYSSTVIGTGSATVGVGALQTSNGQNAPAGEKGSTSSGSASAGEKRIDVGRIGLAAVGLAGALGLAMLL